MKFVKNYWHWLLVCCIFFGEAIILLVLGDNIYAAVCDNLDLFIAQLKMLSDNDAFFTFGRSVSMPMLNGIDRDYFPSEFSIYNILYFILPDLYAYITGYLLKIALSVASSVLLAKYLLKESYAKYEKPLALAALAFSLLPLYPAYSLCFASMPLVLYLLIKIYRESKWQLFAALFFYPLVSYFSFFGAFILGYILIAAAALSIKDKKICTRMLGAFIVLAAGYVCFEYRLFGIMFFSDTETIRSTMVVASYDASGIWKSFADAFLNGVSHARTLHTYFVLPVCIVYFIWNNIRYIKDKAYSEIAADTFNLTMMFIVFNCAVYALYYWEPLRNLVETLLPPLKGFQYGRTVFFNAFAWYFAFFIVLRTIYERKRHIACLFGIIAVVIVGASQCEYSDFFNTVYCNVYKLVKHTEVNQLSYGEFYGSSLMDKIKDDIDYTPDQMAAAYGLHPALLSYNGISTVDGYCGYYSEEYKERFREAIAPVLDTDDNWRSYYDDWGCRAYIFSASGENTYDFGANAEAPAQEILIDEQKLSELGCSYIFSRFEITNADEMKLDFAGRYSDDKVPYSIYLYRLI